MPRSAARYPPPDGMVPQAGYPPATPQIVVPPPHSVTQHQVSVQVRGKIL